ncbi:MAG: hypothetical protein FWD26_03455 [Treponema sp.]|nr:hypothetical protein [Treponema sp.]
MDKNIKAKVMFEISQIDKLICDCEPLLDVCKIKTLDFIELSAAAMVLHSFYNGIENILLMIIKYYDKQLPNSNKWHMELLDKAFTSDDKRKQILDIALKEKMEEYMKFRHFVRHTYGFQLEWKRMEALINTISDFWKIVKDSLNVFLSDDDKEI